MDFGIFSLKFTAYPKKTTSYENFLDFFIVVVYVACKIHVYPQPKSLTLTMTLYPLNFYAADRTIHPFVECVVSMESVVNTDAVQSELPSSLRFIIHGDSAPEDALGFYEALEQAARAEIERFRVQWEQHTPFAPLTVELEFWLSYYNSSSIICISEWVRTLMAFTTTQALECRITWNYDESEADEDGNIDMIDYLERAAKLVSSCTAFTARMHPDRTLGTMHKSFLTGFRKGVMEER